MYMNERGVAQPLLAISMHLFIIDSPLPSQCEALILPPIINLFVLLSAEIKHIGKPEEKNQLDPTTV